MAKEVISLKSIDGKTFRVINEVKAFGAKKNIYFGENGKFVVGIYKDNPDQNSIERINDLISRYREDIFEKNGGNYWAKRFCWPSHIVKTNKGKTGLVFPIYPDNYFFKFGNLKGVEKKGSWFAKPEARSAIDQKEIGNWKNYILASLHLSRTVRRMHSSGLSHSDLSFNNVLVDPTSGAVLVIDIDELVVPNKYPPGVIGTKGFIAPEVMKSLRKDTDDNNKASPNIKTDLHALACLIYLYLLRRHPLIGKKVHHTDAEIDDNLSLGEKAVFIESSLDNSNRPNIEGYSPVDWSNIKKLPYTITGPFLSKLFKSTFEIGLHNPNSRPLASEWENALLKTYNRLVPCRNKNCTEKFFVFNKTKRCPFCGTQIKEKIPVINIYKTRSSTKPSDQIVASNFRKLNKWHFFSDIYINETIDPKDIKRVAYLQSHNDKWFIVNEQLENLFYEDDIGNISQIDKGKNIALSENLIIYLDVPNATKLTVKFI